MSKTEKQYGAVFTSQKGSFHVVGVGLTPSGAVSAAIRSYDASLSLQAYGWNPEWDRKRKAAFLRKRGVRVEMVMLSLDGNESIAVPEKPSINEACERVQVASQLRGTGQTVGWFRLRDCAAVLLEDRMRLLELLRRVADEPNIDRARALADAEIDGSKS